MRAKKALANGNTGFRPRGEKNQRAFEALKSQASSSANISASDNNQESP